MKLHVNSQVTTTVIAEGLDNPRHLIFGPDGALYVTEAGMGGDGPTVPAPEIGVDFKFGLTGAITRIQAGQQERVITNLPSLALAEGPQAGSQAYGPHDIGFDQDGNLYAVTGFTTGPDIRDQIQEEIGDPALDLGRLFKFNLADGSKERLADFVEYEGLNNSDNGDDIVSNPYDLLVLEDKILVVDAGANVLLRVDNGVDISLETIFEPRNVDNFSMQSVPSSAEVGPDGAYYVSEFTGVPYPVDGARIYRVLPGEEPEIYTDGFTNITDIAFGADGSLYVLEFATDLLSPDPDNIAGALLKISPDGVRSTLVSQGEGLIFPTGVATGPDGAIYVSNYGAFPEQGQVLRIEESATSTPEPSSILGILVFFILSIVLFLKPRHCLK